MKQTITYLLCDKCENKCSDSFTLFLGGCVDASGNNGKKYLDFDLCANCQKLFIENILDFCQKQAVISDRIKKFVPRAKEVEA